MNLNNWNPVQLNCTHCQNPIDFRVAHKKAQVYLNGGWVDIFPSAEIVVCPRCGSSVWIKVIKEKAGI